MAALVLHTLPCDCDFFRLLSVTAKYISPEYFAVDTLYI